MRRALERHKNGETRVIPVIVRSVVWEELTPFAEIQVLPPDGRPVTRWPHPDDAWADTSGDLSVVEKSGSYVLSTSSTAGQRQRVQVLQRQTAKVLGLPVEFRDTLKDGSQGR